MYTRRYYDQPQQNIKIPENYKGHAFSDPLRYNMMPPPARPPSPLTDIPPSNIENLNSDKEQNEKSEIYNGSGEKEVLKKETESTVSVAKSSENDKSSSLSSLFFGTNPLSNHFPFGHGIGSEELLILAVMLLVFISGEQNNCPDHEFMLLLGLLLFAG